VLDAEVLTDPAWNNTTVLQGDVVEGVTALKAQDDELRLMVFP
jgi:hypothetical protein